MKTPSPCVPENCRPRQGPARPAWSSASWRRRSRRPEARRDDHTDRRDQPRHVLASRHRRGLQLGQPSRSTETRQDRARIRSQSTEQKATSEVIEYRAGALARRPGKRLGAQRRAFRELLPELRETYDGKYVAIEDDPRGRMKDEGGRMNRPGRPDPFAPSLARGGPFLK